MELSNLVGNHVLSGIERGVKTVNDFWHNECEYIRFCLDGVTYEAVEDPDDGYRSYLKELEVVKDMPKIKLPDCPVICEMSDEDETDILIILDAISKRRVLSIGTDYTEACYPFCVFNYNPENLWCNQRRTKQCNL